MARNYPHPTIRIRRLIITFANQGSRAPLVDKCWGNGASTYDKLDLPWWARQPDWLSPQEEFKYAGLAFLLTPWRRDDRVGFRKPLRALVVGWITSRSPLLV